MLSQIRMRSRLVGALLGRAACARLGGVLVAPHTRASSSSPATPLDAALSLEELDNSLFLQRVETLWTPAGSRAVFGGQIVAAAMLAAERTRTAPFPLHSLHSYFLRPGASGAGAKPILYAVTRLRDGGSFETRAVTARQNGEAIFTAVLSFHKLEADASGGAVGHATRPPVVPPPEACAPLRLAGAAAFPIEIRPVLAGAPAPTWPAKSAAWFRLPPLPPPSAATAHLHRAALAFASDWGLGTASLLPYGVRWGDARLTMAASLDHALFFHDSLDGGAPAPPPPPRAGAADARPITRHADAPRVPRAPAPLVRADDFLLVEFESTALRSSRGLNFSRMWTRDGTLVVSAVQESLLRVAGAPA
jgi:acyl-CoA thioesterase-2